MHSLVAKTPKPHRVIHLVRQLSSGEEPQDIKNIVPFLASESKAVGRNPALKKGTGGRSSFNGTVCTVFGHGHLGGHLINRLGRVGTQIIIPYRNDYYKVMNYKLCGDLGQVLFLPFYLRDEDSIYRAVKHSNVVINTIGKDEDTPSFTLEEVHVEGSRLIARVCREAGVERLIHISALNCHPNPTPVLNRKGSRFYRSKYYGEIAVREEFPSATIFRPSELWGFNDRYLNTYASKYRRTLNEILLWKKGKGVYKMPVCCEDLADAIMVAINDPTAIGQTYDAIG